MAEVKLEIPAENNVLEILYDGAELYQQPPSMSEHLTQLARKVDFGAEDEEMDIEEKDKNDEEKPFQQPHWPLENIRNKVRSSLTEMCVLHDLLQVVKDKRYMVLDPIQTPPPEPKLYLQFLAIKKGLSSAANILLTGAERLKLSQNEALKSRQTVDFHIELLRLRQNWKLKKVSGTIIGDLSYKTGSGRYKHTGIFEVTKAEDSALSPSNMAAVGGMSPVQSPRSHISSLKVNIPADLDGSAYIYVNIRKDEEDICSAKIQGLPNTNRDGYWQKKLECAQNVLFCKELFNQLAREAVMLQPSIPHMVIGNQITSTIFPGIHLLVALCHTDNDNKKKSGLPNGSSMGGGASNNSKSSHDEVLEHSLHQLLYHRFHPNVRSAVPHPISSYIGVSKKRRTAGVTGIEKAHLVQMSEKETLLEKIIKQAQHNLLRIRTMYVIDQLSVEVKDPLIISHWNLFNTPTHSYVRMNIYHQNYDYILRTTLTIHVYERTLKCICRNGKVMELSFETQELRDFMLCQISQHMAAAVQCFSRVMGWSLVFSENCVGVGGTEPLGNSSAVVLASPTGNKLLAVRSSPKSGVYVAVSSSPRNDFYPTSIVADGRWEHICGSWSEVNLDKMEGKNFLNKIDLLIAALTVQT